MSTLAATMTETTDFRGLLEERLKETKSRLGEVEQGIKKFVPDNAGNDNNASSNNGCVCVCVCTFDEIDLFLLI